MSTNTQQQWRPQIAQVSQDGNERMSYIRGLMQDGRMEEAQAELWMLVQQEPQNTRPRMALAYTQLRENQLDDAAANLEEVMRLDPKNAYAPLLAAAVGMRGNKPEYAETQFQKALQINPSSEQALMGLARLHEQQKKPDEAVKVLTHALSQNPHSPRLRQQMARALNGMGKTDEAQKQLEHASETNPDDVRTTMQLARQQMRNNKPAAAVWTVESALSRQPESRALLQMLGTLKTGAGDYAGAEDALRKVMALATAASEGEGPARGLNAIKLSLVGALIPQKKLTEARSLLSQIRQPNLRGFVNRMHGDCFAAEGRVTEAETSYRAALSQARNGTEVLARIDEARAGKTGAEVLELYDAEFTRAREEMQKTMRERMQNGMGPDEQKAMRERMQRRSGLRQTFQQRFGNGQGNGAANAPRGRFRA